MATFYLKEMNEESEISGVHYNIKGKNLQRASFVMSRSEYYTNIQWDSNKPTVMKSYTSKKYKPSNIILLLLEIAKLVDINKLDKKSLKFVPQILQKFDRKTRIKTINSKKLEDDASNALIVNTIANSKLSADVNQLREDIYSNAIRRAGLTESDSVALGLFLKKFDKYPIAKKLTSALNKVHLFSTLLTHHDEEFVQVSNKRLEFNETSEYRVFTIYEGAPTIYTLLVETLTDDDRHRAQLKPKPNIIENTVISNKLDQQQSQHKHTKKSNHSKNISITCAIVSMIGTTISIIAAVPVIILTAIAKAIVALSLMAIKGCKSVYQGLKSCFFSCCTSNELYEPNPSMTTVFRV